MKNILMVDCTDVSSRAIITARQIGYNLIFFTHGDDASFFVVE